MRYNEIAQILTIANVKDDFGGFVEESKLYKKVKCKVAPYTLKTVDSAGAPCIYSYNKLLTKDKIDSSILRNDFEIIYNNVSYKKIAATDYGKCIVIEMETK